MVTNSVIKEDFTYISIVLQKKVSAHWILLYGSDNNIKIVPLALVHFLVRLIPLILFNSRIVI
jgi:hypothetical protein